MLLTSRPTERAATVDAVSGAAIRPYRKSQVTKVSGRGSAEWKELRKIGEKYAKFRAFTVEGLPQ